MLRLRDAVKITKTTFPQDAFMIWSLPEACCQESPLTLIEAIVTFSKMSPRSATKQSSNDQTR